MEIESDIPIPQACPARTRVSKLVRAMKVGDSILVSEEGELSSARKTLVRLGGKPVTRKVEGGWRVWRTR